MSKCPYCHEQLREQYQYNKKPQYRFCPYCGWQLDMDARRVDFELGRIDAINTTKEEILKWIARIIIPINLAGLLIGGVSIYSVMKDTVNSKVDKEIEQRIDDFKKFYSYAKETIPLSILVLHM